MTCHTQIYWHVFYLCRTAVYRDAERKEERTGGEKASTETGSVGPLTAACIADFDFMYGKLMHFKFLFHY